MAEASSLRLGSVLVVDDEPRILSALRRTLERDGWEVLTAESPREALQHLERRPVDLILSDHKMPGMSGLEFLRRAADCRPRAVRMLLTGWTEAVPQGELDALEIRALIPKPWDAAELRQLLRSAVEETHVPR